MADVPARPIWNGSPTELGELFVMRRGRRETTCKLFSHRLGWELRLLMGVRADIMLAKVCASYDDVVTTGEQWRMSLAEKGWMKSKPGRAAS